MSPDSRAKIITKLAQMWVEIEGYQNEAELYRRTLDLLLELPKMDRKGAAALMAEAGWNTPTIYLTAVLPMGLVTELSKLKAISHTVIDGTCAGAMKIRLTGVLPNWEEIHQTMRDHTAIQLTIDV